MQLTETELNHVVFLSEVILAGRKREMMSETMQCLLYIVKSLQDVELPDDVADEIRNLVSRVEDHLRSENDRMKEIEFNLTYPSHRSPLG